MQMANDYMKRYSTSLIIVMQMKPNETHHTGSIFKNDILSELVRIWRMNRWSLVEGNLILFIKTLNVNTLPPNNFISKNLSIRMHIQLVKFYVRRSL